MTHATHRLSRLASASAVALALAAPIGLAPIFATPAQAFFFGGGGRIVYDPRNHAENILSAARALEQINNQITQLQNEAQMLMNQARDLASLPYSSLQALQQNVDRTRQLLSQAQNIAFDVAQIDQVFQQDYANIPMAAPEAQLLADARSRWENTVGGLQDALRVGADGEPEIVNSRIHGNVLIVDRLFGAAELRLGRGPRQEVVRILRIEPQTEATVVRQDAERGT